MLAGPGLLPVLKVSKRKTTTESTESAEKKDCQGIPARVVVSLLGEYSNNAFLSVASVLSVVGFFS
jgi:hypothetical protein